MSKKLLIFFSVFAPVFAMESDVNFYNVNFDKDQKLINIKNEITYVDILEKFNNQYDINAEFLVESGVLPFTTFYMLEENKDYSAELNIISSYQIEGVDIDLENETEFPQSDSLLERFTVNMNRRVKQNKIFFYWNKRVVISIF